MSTEKRKIRYGIIGFGRFAENAITPAIKASPNSELVAIQKRSLETANERAASLGIPYAFSSVSELVAHPEVDAVFIVSANSQHCDETIAAAKASKHVLVEKPMAINVREAGQMIAACQRHGVKLMVGHMIRFSPLVRRMREIVQLGAIGRVTFVKSEFFYDARLTNRSWLFDPKIAGGGPVFDIGVHCLDTIRFILDDNVVSTKSDLQPRPTETVTEATGSLVLRFSRGTLGSIYCSYEAPTRRSFIEIMGTEGMLSASDFTLGDRKISLHIGLRKDGNALDSRSEEITVPNLYIEEVTHFSKCILENVEPSIPGSVGLENQQVLDAALRVSS